MRLRGATLVLAFVASAAGAQVAPGHSPQHDDYVATSLRTKSIAQCVLGRAPKASRDLVLSTDAEEGRHARPAITQALRGCMSARDASMTVQVFGLRGDLAEAMLRQDGAAALQRARSMPPQPAVRLTSSGGPQDAAIIACSVRADPADAAQMIEEQAATPEELAAFRKLLPSVQACVPTGYALHLKPDQVRREVAIALYRVTQGGVS